MSARLAVIGVGHMGRFHATKVRELATAGEGVELAGVADLDRERAQAVAQEAGTRAVVDFRELLADIDAAVVAVPTVHHAEIVGALLAAGKDVLVEKPIAATLSEAEKLVGMARERGCILQVGHLEWFNSAMRAAVARVSAPRFIEAHRLGPFPARATDVDVVRDLMIHDLDIVQRLVGAEPERIDSIGIPVVTERVDIANARLAFPTGCVANFTASRVSSTAMRKLRVFQPDGYVSIDFNAQSLTVAWRDEPDASGTRQIRGEELAIDREDALVEQLRSFRDAVETRTVAEGAAGQGLAALRTALRIVDEMPALDPAG